MLYLVGTPIGNLSDMTLRALETLKSVPVIIVEKYTDSIKLLRHFEIKPETLLSFDDRNAKRTLPKILEILSRRNAAYIVSAGMPGISDPCSLLMTACREDGVSVLPIPGPSAVTAAVTMAGFGNRAFFFAGFLPKKPGQLKKVFEEARENDHLLVFFESTHRIVKTLQFLAATYPDSRLFIGKEMTKVFEAYLSGTPEELRSQFEANKQLARGEFTCVLSFE